MGQLVASGICFVIGLIGLSQVFVGWRSGEMFAFDPGGASAPLKRSDGWIFVAGWWLTLVVSLGVGGLGIGMLFHD